MQSKISLETMPQAIMELIEKVDNLQKDLIELKNRPIPIQDEPMIGIEEACKILGRAKSTIYALTQSHKIPFYQPGKMLQFRRSELIGWMENARQATTIQSKEDMLRQMQDGVRHKPKSNWETTT